MCIVVMAEFVIAVFMFVLLCLSAAEGNFYALTATDIAGNEVLLEEYNGKVSMVVNVASECGYTDLNYRELVKLQEKYGSSGFTVLAFPCNQFGQQEPGRERDIVRFAREGYGVTFPLFSKVDVHGEQTCTVYRYLTSVSGRTPSWNFCKYLVDQAGHVVQYFSERDTFQSISQSVENLLISNKSYTHREL